MTIKEAILKSLEDLQEPSTYLEIYRKIMENGYYPQFRNNDTPENTVSAQLGEFIRKSDSRVKRMKLPKGVFGYYLTKNEQAIGIDVLTGTTETVIVQTSRNVNTYHERDLHRLLATYLKSHNIDAATVYHERSSSKGDKHQKWIHPDMVGIAFLKLENSSSQALQWTVNRNDTFKLNSYEIKKEINTDYELKESFFQAVSNSSWANHGFLVAFYFNESLHDEMKRLSLAFGIGIIELKANPYESRLLFPSSYKELDFKTIDKLCKINSDFEGFIKHTEKIMSADAKYREALERELQVDCDKPLLTDADIEGYCLQKFIPMETLT
ncbi:MAG: hypothetical protein K9J06_10325 [Flavobacteriales bacterium]|nr:hypothetical protein [Flavobacteriales bacterium]